MGSLNRSCSNLGSLNNACPNNRFGNYVKMCLKDYINSRLLIPKEAA